MAQTRKETKALPFYEERALWSFAHATCALALYIASRNIVLSLLLMFVWESYEAIASRYVVFFLEDIGDSLIGDPLVGALAIFTAWLIGQATGWDAIALEEAGFWRRWLCFVVIALINSGVGAVFHPDGQRSNRHIVTRGVILVLLLQVVTIFSFYGNLLESRLGPNIVWWLLMGLAYGWAAAMPTNRPSTFFRVVVMEILVLLGNFIAFVFIREDKDSARP